MGSVTFFFACLISDNSYSKWTEEMDILLSSQQSVPDKSFEIPVVQTNYHTMLPFSIL